MNGPRTPLLTDYCQLTMLHAYYESGMNDTAVFEFFFRALPGERNFLLAAGLEQALDYLEQLHFSEEELRWLGQTQGFPASFLAHLAELRFTGEVHAIPEGTVCYPNEPLLRITAPIEQAQLIESRLINVLHFQTLVASKAARCVLAAPDKLLVDFGMRRAHGAEAGVFAARASYLAGFAGTATVLAGRSYGVPLYGTMAHSFVEAHATESLAFEHFARAQPDNVVLLIDTYDTEAGAEQAAALAPHLARHGIRIRAVRLDSGDLGAHAVRVRRVLDQHGLQAVQIFCSGNLDEYALRALLAAGAPIDGYGVGTSLTTSSDAPALDCAYKLSEYAGTGRRKLSEHKATWPGRKQVYRSYAEDDSMAGDVVALDEETRPGEALLRAVMRGGRRLQPADSVGAIRERAAAQLDRLPAALKSLDPAPAYPVEISPALRRYAAEVDREIAARQSAPAPRPTRP